MGFNSQFPYSDFHELNADWLIQRTKELETTTAYLMEEWSKIEILTEEYIQSMIDRTIASNNLKIAAQLEALKAELTTQSQAYTNAKIDDLKLYLDNQDIYYLQLAKSYSDNNLAIAEAYTDTKVLNYTMMINPITGEYEDVREVVDDIVSYFHTENSLTAAEYDALELTASDYDAYELTAYDYDFNGKNLLV